MLDEALTARIAAAKRRLLDGGLLQLVSWGVPVGERDERGRITYSYSDLDALIIEQRPALDRGRHQYRQGRQHGADNSRSAGNHRRASF